MIKVWYDHRVNPNQKLLPIKSVDIGDKIARKDKEEWVIPNHYRGQNEKFMRQIGVRFVYKKNNVEKVSIASPDGKCCHDFIYDSDKDIWFEPTLFSNKKRKGYYLYEESSVLAGITNAGTAKLNWTVNGLSNNFATIHFVPSSLSIEDYEEMIADLYRIREGFVRDGRNVAKVGMSSNKVVMELREQLKKLTIAIKQIDANPHMVLDWHMTKKKPYNYGRFDLRMEIEQYMNPGKPNYRSRSLIPHVATYENKLMKQLLEDLIRYAASRGLTEITTKFLLRDVIDERETLFRKSDLQIQRLLGSVENIEDIYTYNRIHNMLTHDLEQYLDEESSIRKRNKALADYTENPKGLKDMQFIELTLEMNGVFTKSNQYYHHQSVHGMRAQLKYDRREQQLGIKGYALETPSGLKLQVPNSHFGTILLGSNHVQSQFRFYKAFCEEAQIQSEHQSRTIVIRGLVRPQTNGIDAVATPRYDDFYDYTFDFVYISSIHINGKEILVPADSFSLLEFLDNELPVMMYGAEQSEEAFMRLKQLEKLRAFTRYKEEIQNAAAEFDELRETAESLLEFPLFSTLDLNERLPIRPTQVFLHNPTYRVAWQAIKRIKHELSASLYVEQHQRQISTGKVEHIFEVWILYKILHLLTNEMGWSLKGYKNVTACLDEYLLGKSHKGLQNLAVTLTWQQWQVELYYEPRIDLPCNQYLTPDFVLKFKKNNRSMGIVVLDAKYRNYHSQGAEQWVKDIVDIAIDKYGSMQPIDSKWQAPILASGIIHSDITISENAEDMYNPYHVMYNEELFNTNLIDEKAHKYGSIYMIPSKTYVFKNWFRLIMEYHLNEHKVCWNCGEAGDVHERVLLTQRGYPKYYYTCKKCNEFWVKVHCSLNGHKLVKHMNNYHLQVESRNKWYVVCPSCGDGRPAQENPQLITTMLEPPLEFINFDFDEDLPF
ncbi:nuclease domain-containing protein [Gracilibacillus sp. Marseille-QA3620]